MLIANQEICSTGGRKVAGFETVPFFCGTGCQRDIGWKGRVADADMSSLVLTVWWAVEER
jgi:hypothetical protein